MSKCVDVPGSYDLWESMSHDEANHAQMLLFLKESLPKDTLMSPAGEDLCRLAITVRDMGLAKYKPRNAREALEIAHEIESREIKFIFQLITEKFIHNDVRRKMVTSQIKEHQQKLIIFKEKWLSDRKLLFQQFLIKDLNIIN